MGKFTNDFRSKRGLGRRILSFVMVFAMMISLAQTLPGSLLTVKAADSETNIKVHFYNEYSWTAPALQYWGGSSTTLSGYVGDPAAIEGWGATDQGYTLTDEGNGWYSVSLKGDFTGFQFLDMTLNSENGHDCTGGIYSSYMEQYASDTAQDLYCKHQDTDDDGIADTWKWYTDEACTTELAAPADATKCTVTLHYQNSESWSEVAAYVCDSGWGALPGDYAGYASWPGKTISANADHEGWYDVVLEDLTVSGLMIIFNNNNNGAQTGDLSLTLSGDTMEAWVVGKSATEVVTTAPEAWTNPDSGSDNEGEKEEDGNDETNAASMNVSDSVQLKIGDDVLDMQLYMNGIYETAVKLAAGTYEAKALVNGEEYGSADSVTLTEETTVYFRLQDGALKDSVNNGIVHTAALVGNFSGLSFKDESGEAYTIGSWAPSDANAEIAYVGGGIYTRTFLFDELAADLEIADGGYKVAFDDAWDYSIGSGGGNITLTIPAGSTALTVYVDEINQVVYDSVRTEDFESVHNSGNVTRGAFVATISLIGTVREGNGDWDAATTGFEFTQISDTLYRYQKTFDEGSYAYKCVFDYADWYEAEEGNKNIAIAEDDTNVVFIYNTEDGKLYDSVNNEEALAVMLGMKAAPAKMQVTDNANGSTTFTALADAGKKVTLYYGVKSEVEANGTSALETASTTAGDKGDYNTDAIYFGDGALDIVYYYDVDGTKVLDGSNPTVTVGGAEYSNYTREAFTGRIVNVAGTFPGPSWDATSNVMTYKGNGLYVYTFEDVPAANYEFKIAFNSWDPENYGANGVDHGANIAVTVPETQDVSVYYNDFSHLAVTTIDYIFADIDLKGTGIPDGLKMTDDGLTGIYSAVVYMAAGTYTDVQIVYNGETYTFAEFTVDEDKNVTFYFDPVTGIFYNNASNEKVDTDSIYYNTKDTTYKSVFGAVEAGEDVRFTIATGTDVVSASMVVKGVDKKTLTMEKDGEAVDGIQKWSVTTSFDSIGEYDYYFVVSNGSAVSVYADDDGYYGEGTTTDLTNITPYDLVVYEAGFETPDWMKNAVIYQIFPDRFFNGDTSNDFAQTSARGEVDYEYIKDWYMIPENPEQEGLLSKEDYEATGAFYGDQNWSNEIYGGDFAGIVERIDYLKALGVNVIYLNPVFASISNHRYDTSDYSIIDPVLGDLGDFEELVRVAEENDMHIILDGVFNHVSDDSIYFDRYYKYLEAGTDTIGAYPYWAYVYDYMAENSVDEAAAEKAAKAYFTENYGITNYSYTGWFDVYQTPMSDGNGGTVSDNIGLRAGKPVYGYEGWWGYDSMPVIMSTNGSEYQTGTWAEEIIGNEDGTSVTQYWISKGNNGWRLDVANEVSDETWQNFRDSVKALDSDAVIVGEIWDDATKYLMGDMYDSVMNYVFRGAVLGFAKGGSSEDAMNTLERIRERYPEEAFYAMMNLVDSHDTTRVLSYLDGIDDDRNQKDTASAFPTYENTSDEAKARQYLVAFLQFTYAGAPTIYYGDEIGMVGADDPDDRRAFTWGEGNEELVTWYATLAAIRANYPALRTGSLEVFGTNESIVSYVRRDNNETARDSGDELIVLANNAKENQEITLNTSDLNVNATELTDLISGTTYTVADGSVTVTVPALSGVILTANVKEINVDKAALAPAFDSSYIVEESVLAEGITLDKTTESLKAGESVTLTATVTPADVTDQTVIWTSSDEAVATVDANGNVTAVAEGNAVITAKAVFSPEELLASCEVTVTKAEIKDNYTGLRKDASGKWIYVTKGVKNPKKTGLVPYDGAWFYVEKGELNTDLVGFVDYDGGSFYVACGRVCSEYSGLVQNGDTWYFVADGQLQKQYSGLALYDGEWFLLANGILNKTYNGLFEYDGSQFLVADGQILSSYSGLYQATDGWYYISSGQVSNYTGLVMYDGAWFYVQKGKLAQNYCGWVLYDARAFLIINGQVAF